jgi:hypothetical protein
MSTWGRRFDAGMDALRTMLSLAAVFALILGAYGWPNL